MSIQIDRMSRTTVISYMFCFRSIFINCMWVSLAFVSGGSIESAPSIGQSARLKKIVESKKIQIGLQVQEPLVVNNENRPGIDVELANQLASDLGVEVEIIYALPNQLINMINQGQIDLALGGISANMERGLKVRFTRPYLIATAGGLLNRNRIPTESESIEFTKRKISTLQDLQIPGKLVVAVRADTTNETLLRETPRFSTFQIETFATNQDALDALRSNKVDMLVADDIWIRYAIKTSPDLVSRFLPIVGIYREEHISIAVPPGDMEFWHVIDFMIKEYQRTGAINRIVERYFDVTRDIR